MVGHDRHKDDYSLRVIHHRNRADEARRQGIKSQAEYHDMMARLYDIRRRAMLRRYISPKIPRTSEG